VTLWGWFRRPRAIARITPLGTQHARRVAEIHASAFARPWGSFEFERLLADKAVLADGVFLAGSRGPDGFVLSRRVLDEAELLTVAMAPEARGGRHSRPLLLHHLSELTRAGVRTVHLEVEEGNVPALALYRRLGFAQVGRREGYYAGADGRRAAALTMSLPL
jgi:[ribosomal protein S18]-alanine N-acetyltransferase